MFPRVSVLAFALCLFVLLSASFTHASSAPAVPISSPHVAEWTSGDILVWLSSIGLSKYRTAFLESGVDGRMLAAMTDAQLNLFLEDDPAALDTFVSEFKKRQAMGQRATVQAQGDDRTAGSSSSSSSAASGSSSGSGAKIPDRLANDAAYLSLMSRPIASWSVGDVSTFLVKTGDGFEAYLSRFTWDAIDGSALMKLDRTALQSIFLDDPLRPKQLLDIIKETMKEQKKKNKATQAEEVDQVDVERLLTSMGGDATQNRAPVQMDEAKCTTLISPDHRVVLDRLKAHLSVRDALASVSSVDATIIPDVVTGPIGCPRMLARALPLVRSTQSLLVLFGRSTEDVHLYMRAHGWTNLTMLSFDELVGPHGTKHEDLDDLYMNIDPVIGVCALYHMGIVPDVIYVQDTVVHKVFLSSGRDQHGPSSCDCVNWHALWSQLPAIGSNQRAAPVLMGDYEQHRPNWLNNLTNVLRTRVYVDAPCWAASDLGSSTVTSEQSSSFACNDTMGDGLLSHTMPLISAFMILDPSPIGRMAARFTQSIDSFADQVDNLLVVNIIDKEGGLEEQANMFQMVKEAKDDHPNLQTVQVVHWKLIDFDNSYSKLRNHALSFLSASDRFISVFQLAIQAEETLAHAAKGKGLRAFLEGQRQLCGPSQTEHKLTVLLNETSMTQETRVFRRGNHLMRGWDPDYPEEHTKGYTSSSGERYASWGREAQGNAITMSGRASPMQDGGAAMTLHKQILTVPVDRLMRDVGQLMAQEAELYAKIAWWADRYPADASNNFTLSTPPLRWTSLLAHTHFTLARAYEQNNQLGEATEYYMHRIERVLHTPLDADFSHHADQPMMVRVPSGGRVWQDDESQQACTSLYKLHQLHTRLNVTDMSDELKEMLLAVQSKKYTSANLDEYYLLALVKNCGQTQVEALYAWIDRHIEEGKWHVAQSIIGNMYASEILQRAPCRIDPTVCRTKLPAAIVKVHAYLSQEAQRKAQAK